MRMFLSTHIDATQDRIFAAASDFPNAASFITAIEAIEMLSPAADGSPIGLGTRFKETRTMFGKQAVETMEVTEFDPPRAYTLSAHSCGVQFHSRITVLEETPGGQRNGSGGGCRLSFDVHATPTTFVARVMSAFMTPLMKGTMRKAMEKDLADIKRHAERSGAHHAEGVLADSDDVDN